MANLDSQRSERWARWLNRWTLLCLPAFGFALIMWGAHTTFYISTAIAFITILVLIGMPDDGSDANESLRAKTVRTARVSLCATAAFLALTMLAQVSGGFWLVLLISMLVTMPPATAFLREAWGRISNGTATETEGADPAEEAQPPIGADHLQDLTDVELCCLWRHSFWDLESAKSGDERVRIALKRQEILDELTRRNAPAVDAWLASGARASSSPERFFKGDDSGQPAAA